MPAGVAVRRECPFEELKAGRISAIEPFLGKSGWLDLAKVTSWFAGRSQAPAPDSPGLPRSETSIRESFRKKVDFANLNRGPARMPVHAPGLQKKPRA
jgi:hypothetical protein